MKYVLAFGSGTTRRSSGRSRVASLLLSSGELTRYMTLPPALQQDLLQESDVQKRRWLLALELHSYFIRKLLKNPLSPARRSNFHRKVVLWQRLLSSYLAAERSSPRRYAALPRERPWLEIR